jgi:hypothetical protein
MEASMQSSDSIAQFAAALAKAQVELQNPPKSLTAYLEPGPDGSPGQAYRYAPLSAGLEIVRKALGAHKLAVVQTTSLDPASDRLMLTTTLAHASGEWIASTWPVCGRAEMAHPKLRGAALTYARRYSLFALVGLAGEDDLDAPDLKGAQANDTATEVTPPAPEHGGRLHRAPARDTRLRATTPVQRASGAAESPALPQPKASELLAGLDEVETSEALLRWALSALPSCHTLKAADRAVLDAAFLARAKALGTDPNVLLAFNLDGTRWRKRRAHNAEHTQTSEQAYVAQPAL